MVEILVSMVVLSIGLLGLARLETLSTRMNQSAYFRTQASIFSQDMIARMRANQPGVENADYNGLPDPQRVANCLTTTGCSSTDLANNDAFDWNLALAATLPSGQGTVCVDSTPEDGTNSAATGCDGIGSIAAVKVWWLDDRTGSGLLRFSTSFQP
ncbi:MAG TPA: type IV pilus modification protein PilV [Gammaproteobacteria bacterium]|jgi:type IV pilus assembly protein PilV|nr:type IV pilus modification protein PilV [Gammaproteobacteria bacterium]